MVMLLEHIPISQSGPAMLSFLHTLGEEDRGRLRTLGERAVATLAPLARVTSRQQLDALLPTCVPTLLMVKQAVWELLQKSAQNPNEIRERLAGFYKESRSVVERKADILGNDAEEQLLGVLDSAEGLSEWALDSVLEGAIAAQRVALLAQQVGQNTSFVEACVSAVLLVLSDNLEDWSPEALRLLCGAADDHMTAVEDVFLSLLPKSKLAGETVEYESVRSELGL